MQSPKTTLRISSRIGLALLLALMMSGSAFAQGSIFGPVTNADLSVPANGEITFVGYLDDTDEEIRIESSDGAGYDAGNWFDDFQNYLTEAAGNPYDYHFYNVVNGQGFQLSAVIPNNSFQQENVTLAPVAWPVAPSGLSGVTVSGNTVVLSWTGVGGLTYHVYRRMASSNGSFFRIDDPSGSLANPGVSGGFFVDNTTDGVSTYQYLIIAEDPSGNLSPHSASATVNSAAADAPVLVSIDPTTGTALGGTTVTVNGSGFDPAGAQVFFGATPVDATVLSPFQMTVVTPSGSVGASVDVAVVNTASGETSNTLTGGYVYSANAEPLLAAIGAQTVVENAPLQFTVTATDPDGTTPAMTSTALPGAATYVDNGDGTGSFDWTPGFTEAGDYFVTFYATDAVVPTAVDSEIVTITVTEAGNQTPVLGPIADTTIDENQTLAFQVTATDADLDPIGLTVIDLPTNATFLDNGDGTADFSFTPDFTQAGLFAVTFTATDSALNTTNIVVQITVNDINQLPVLAAIGPQTTPESVELTFLVNATDDDGVVPVLTTTTLPGTATFVDSLNGVGLFTWTPTFADSGSYDVTFYAADAIFPAEVDSEVVTITVTDGGNQAPVLADIGAQTAFEGITLGLVITATDADGAIPSLTAENLPTNATFLDNGDGTAAFDFTPDFLQAGLYSVLFIASDGLAADSELVDITVTDAGNVPPVIDSLGDFTVNEADQLIINVTASDPDGGGLFPALSVSTTLSNFSFVDNGDGTGILTYDPDYFDAGLDTVSFLAIDFGSPQATSSLTSIVTTVDVNQAPVIDSIGPFAVAVGDSIEFTITASDTTAPDPSSRIFLSTLGVPANASFADNGDNTGTFRFSPDAGQTGLHQVTFLAVDQGTPQLSMTLAVDLSVVTENAPPILDPIGAQVITEGVTLNVPLSASDPDGGFPAFEMTGEPDGATLTDNGDGTGLFSYTPEYYGTQRLVSVTIRAIDGIGLDKEVVLIQIYDAGNQAPAFDSVPSPSVIEGESLVQGVSATDPDRNPLTLWIDESTVPLPANMEFLDVGEGIGAFTFNPDFTQAGLYDVYLVAADGPDGEPETLADTVILTFDVVEFGNHAPTLAAIAPQSTFEDFNVSFGVSASDIDGDLPVLTTSPLPLGAIFTDNGDGTGNFSWTPTFDQAGSYDIIFYGSDGTDTDSTIAQVTVNDNNRQPFIFAPGYSYSILEADTLTLVVTSFDPDGVTPILTAYLSGQDSLATNMTFVDNLDGTGTFVFMPDYTQGLTVSNPNDFFVVFRATDAVYTDAWQEDATVTIGVIDRNKPPELTFPSGTGPFSLNEGEQLQFFVSVTDDDPVIGDPTIRVEDMPATNASFSMAPGTTVGQFTFNPSFVQAGTYNVRFIGVDDRGGEDTVVVQIDVLEAGNQAPTFGNSEVDTLLVPSGYDYEIVVAPYDPEADSIVVEAFPMLPGATWTAREDGTWSYGFSAESQDIGSVYEINFVVTDYPGLASDTLTTHPRVVAFLRGDLDADNMYTVGDVAYFIEYLFRNGPAPAIEEAADTDANGNITINDLAYLIYYMFRRGPTPAP